MRIAWLSNAPWAKTGYGTQCNLFAPRMKALGHEVAVIAFYGLEGGTLVWNGIPVYPKAYDPYGNDIMAAHSANFRADITLTNMDTWVLNPAQMVHNMRWVPWMPVDHEPVPPVIVEKTRMAFSRIVYTRFAEQELTRNGLDSYYVPMGVDTDIYKPMPQAQARKDLGFGGDIFIVGMVAMNKGTPSRKCFTQNLEAFANFHKRHPDTYLYLHTQRGDSGELGGVPLTQLTKDLGIADCTQFCDQYGNVLGFPDDYMMRAYNAMDVLLAVSMGEGFGIPVIEAQACGKPVIVGDWTSTQELCFAGWKIDKRKAEKFRTPLNSYQYIPRLRAIEESLEIAYKHARKPQLSEMARAGAMHYDANHILEKYWKPTLEDINRKIKALNVQFIKPAQKQEPLAPAPMPQPSQEVVMV